jgi:exonuclease SbcD
VYSGSIERVTFGERGEDKGFYLVDIDAGAEGSTQTQFVETPARAFVAVQVDAREAEDPTERILAAIDDAVVADAVVRVRYHVDEEQIPLVDQGRIREALTEADTIAAIERTVDPAERKRRTVVTRESSLEEALRQYVAQHDELDGIEDELVEAARALDAEDEATTH